MWQVPKAKPLPIGLASDDVTKLSNALQRGKLVLNKGSTPYKSMLGEKSLTWQSSFFFVEVQKRKKRSSEHQTKTGKEWWRNVSPSQGLLQSPICRRLKKPLRGRNVSPLFLSFFVERFERFWQLLHCLVRHISKDIRGRTSAGRFFGRSTIFQHDFVWDAIFV